MRYVLAVAVLMTGVASGLESSAHSTGLTVEQAKAAAQYGGLLYLDGLTTLSDEAARALAQHKGWLFLNGLATLTKEAAKALIRRRMLEREGPPELPDLSALELR